MKLFTLTLTLMSFLILSPASLANDNGDKAFTVYLVRHAEKVADQKNSPLTACGEQRAEQIATILSKTNIKQIYSTQTQRTEQTATPLADKLNLKVITYSAKDLPRFAQQIKKEQTNILIVGHSNTTPQLAALIANTPVSDITEAEYQMLYQISFQNGNAHLTFLKQPLTCQ